MNANIQVHLPESKYSLERVSKDNLRRDAKKVVVFFEEKWNLKHSN